MRIARFAFAPYALPLIRPWQTSQGEFTSRYGCLIAFETWRGEVGVGEMAPLGIPDPKAEAELSHILERLRDTRAWPRLSTGPEGFDEWCAQCRIPLDKFPDLTFAVQCALAGLWSVRTHQPLRNLLKSGAPGSMRVNAVIPVSTPAETLTAAARAFEAGYRTFKFKLGARPMRDDLQLMTTVREQFPQVRLRADANGAWTFRDAKHFLREALPLKLEYVEDPLRTPSESSVKALSGNLYASIALDEASARVEHNLAEYHILKPARYATFTALKQLAAAAEQRDTKLIFSGSFESSVGLSYAAVCASAFGCKLCAHGLATASWLAEDTLTTPLLPHDGGIKIPDIYDLPACLLPRYKDELGIAK